jgi:hypothetical protein
MLKRRPGLRCAPSGLQVGDIAPAPFIIAARAFMARSAAQK